MTCAKTAEPTEMQFGMLSRVGPRHMYYMVCRGTFWGCLADWKAL